MPCAEEETLPFTSPKGALIGGLKGGPLDDDDDDGGSGDGSGDSSDLEEENFSEIGIR